VGGEKRAMERGGGDPGWSGGDPGVIRHFAEPQGSAWRATIGAMGELFTSTTPGAAETYALVALEQGIDAAPAGLTYRVPPELGPVAPGTRVMVPLGKGNQRVSGYVVGLTATTDVDSKKIKPIAARDAGAVSLPGDLVELARWISGYYCCPLGMVFATMLPAAVKRQTGATVRTLVRRQTGATPEKLTRLQQAIYEQANDAWIDMRELADAARARTIGPVKQLIDKGVLESKRDEVVASDLDMLAAREKLPGSRFTLMPQQRVALDALVNSLGTFGVHLLHGVTGSGKTEVYLCLIDALMSRVSGIGCRVSQGIESDTRHPIPDTRQHPGVIVLVPEIALTPQTVARFTQRFDDVAVLHSGLTAAQRHHQWRRIREGKAHIVVGARSAIFAPLDNLQLIIVDEEHENSYKQDQLPRYHARDVAIKRAQGLNIPVLLGSATPSLESYYNAVKRPRKLASGGGGGSGGFGGYSLLSIPDRVAGMKLPRVDIVDMKHQRRKGFHLLSEPLEIHLAQTLASGGQVMLLLNRRGYANYIACPDHRCGWMMTCAHCDVTMVYHKDRKLPAGGVVRCHHCEAEQTLPQVCPDSGHRVTVFGLGTQKVEEEIAIKFPQAKRLRMDSDSMRKAADYQQSLEAFRRGDVHVLLGTQMIAKGLDFPNVRLVGVINGDTSLHMPDFRSEERTFQLIAQVAGRAGRSDRPGLVIVQSFNPDNETIALAAAHDYTAFAERELAKRQQSGLPPVTRMARIVVRDKDHVACHRRAAELAENLRKFDREMGTNVRFRGPMPCPIARVADFHRIAIELIAPTAAQLQKLMTALRNSRLLISDKHTAVDVDPVAMM